MLYFSNTELVYQINCSPKTMNCNLIIANDYGNVTQDINDIPEKS